MAFFQPYAFKATLSKPELMNFIAKTSAELYFMAIPPKSAEVCGVFINEEMVEYFTNEFLIERIQPGESKNVREALAMPGCRKCGNEGLLEAMQ